MDVGVHTTSRKIIIPPAVKRMHLDNFICSEPLLVHAGAINIRARPPYYQAKDEDSANGAFVNSIYSLPRERERPSRSFKKSSSRGSWLRPARSFRNYPDATMAQFVDLGNHAQGVWNGVDRFERHSIRIFLIPL